MIIHLRARCPRICLLTRPPSHANTLPFKSPSARLRSSKYSTSVTSRPPSPGHDCAVKTPTCWTVLTTSSEKAYDLQPPRLYNLAPRNRPGRVPLVLLLVTPVHIGLLNDDVGFIPRIIRRYLKPDVDQEIDLLAAVVDRVPCPPAAIPVHNGESGPLTFSRQQCSEGFQGVSIALLDSSQLAPHLWDEQPIPSKAESSLMGAQKTSSLSFCFGRFDGKSQTVHMSLANTIFQNNKLSTLFIRRYIRSDVGAKSSGMEPIKERFLEHQTVIMNDSSSSEYIDFRNAISSRLTPITPPRNVAAAVGNIIRQIFDHNGNVSPASHELESTINSAIRDGRLDRGLVEVWALLRPQQDEMNLRNFEASFDFEAELTKGARLLKVLSGGGGWGEKQGLLALDPDIPAHQTLCKNTDIDETYTSQGKLFEDIVRTDDTVTFLVNGLANSSDTGVSGNQSSPVNRTPGASLRDTMVEFGSIPSTVDDISGPLGVTESANALNHVLIKDYFGMLSEHGMSMTTSHEPPNLEQNLGKTGLAATLDHATKLDAPYIVLSIQFETNDSEHDDGAEALPSETDSTGNNVTDDKTHGASDATLQQLEAAFRAQKVVTTALNPQPSYRPRHKGVEVTEGTPQHNKTPAARHDRRKGVRYTLSDSHEDSDSNQELKQIRNADGGFQLTKYLSTPERTKAKAVEKALRAQTRSSELRDTDALQSLYKEQLAQGATTAEALALIERMKGTIDAPGEGSSKRTGMPRISKHASLSDFGKAMERHERGPLTSRKFAP